MSGDARQITLLLQQVRMGNSEAGTELVSVIYDQLRRLARQQLQGERPGHTLQPTALVNELFLRLKLDQSVDWQDRAHLFAVVARTMRRILVDHARAHNAQRRPSPARRVEIEDTLAYSEDHPVELLVINDALERLAEYDPRQAKVVELRFFAGLTVEETAAALNVTGRTVRRDWQMARAWLSNLLNKSPNTEFNPVE